MYLKNSYKNTPKKLEVLLNKYNKGKEVFNFVKLHNEKKDKQIYKILRNRFGNIGYVSKGKIMKRSYNKAGEIINILKKIGKKYGSITKLKTYLDIGIGNGFITHYISKYLRKYYGVKKLYGIDIMNEMNSSLKNRKIFIFKTYDGINIPIKKIDLATIIMVLHHVKNVNGFLKSLYKSMNDGGILIIKEHNICDKNDLYLVKIQHDILYNIYGNSIGKRLYEKYYSKNDIINLLKRYGFEYIGINFLFNDKFNPTKYIYLIFKKKGEKNKN